MTDTKQSLVANSARQQMIQTDGFAFPLGPTLTEEGCNFSVYCPEGERVELCLYDDSELEVARIELQGRQGGYRYGHIVGVQAGQLYGLRVSGPYDPEQGHLFDAAKLLIDPYAKALNRPLEWDEGQYEGDSQSMVSKCVVIDQQFDWQDVPKPAVPPEQTILYELHVKGFTKLHQELTRDLRGRYLGLTHPAVIEHLQQLGVTSVQLLPVASFMSEPRLKELGLVNYWGYNPINFFAPDPRYAHEDAVTEFKTLVRELHRHGIEVILDVVFNHTAESGDGGPQLSFKGLDNRNYYCFEHHHGQAEYRKYINNTGCGNSFNVDHPNGLRLVMDAMRYWVTEMQVDGFRFDLAVTLARESNEFSSRSAFFKLLEQDPVLSRAKLIAEPWDIGPGGYRLGQFPVNWNECNDRYRDCLRAFWRGDRGLVAEIATRLLGSRDIFPKTFRPGHASVNYLCYHDGFTLEDMVSYVNRYNQANCEGNRDGHGHNLSVNYGIEGRTNNAKVLARRQQQKRNMIASLFLSQGIPHFLAGDEFGRSQLGNNNAYCQDNAISWVNWNWRDVDVKLLAFTQRVIHLRRTSRVFTEMVLEDDHFYGNQPRYQVHWFRPDGHWMEESDWHDRDCQAFAVDIYAKEEQGERWLLLINADGQPVSFHLHRSQQAKRWLVELDTAVDDGKPWQVGQRILRNISLEPHSLVLVRCCD